MNKPLLKSKFQVLRFQVQKVRMCMDLDYVKKVLPLIQLETVPSSPTYLTGLMNLAGKSIPVIDLALRLGLKRNELYTLDNQILLCSDGTNEIGLIVDNVIGLANVSEEELQMRSDFDNSPFIAAVTLENELSLFLNMSEIIAISLTLEKSGFIFDKELYQFSES